MSDHEWNNVTGRAIARELAIVSTAVVAYFGVRGVTEGSRMAALANAQIIIGLERRLGMFWEPTLQRMVVDDSRLVTLMNWIYIWGHWPVIASIGIWLFLRHRPTYLLARNALLLSGTVGLVIFATFPVAPPRLTDLEVRDTVTIYSRFYRVLQPPQFVNQYAALPSLHFGWDLLIGMVAMSVIRWRLVKLLCWLMPLAMLLAIILTANHYILDAVAGAVVALTGLQLAQRFVRPTAAADHPLKPQGGAASGAKPVHSA